ncbi:LysR family transcriptional regulator [Palleronia sediminis]|uniref:LysR family transcriptional regulator n=2 Tax=Palleronia sediminis TaxID=2547833 RepID=A0A4R6A6T6_9RHOB|nr:LysR family transcriptional regulator [Palleronia sediminis]
MDLRQLHTLIAVADTGSFAGAARIVHLTASAVSQQIQALEGELGVAVFDRAKRPPQLNAKGEEVVRAARQVVQIMAETRMSISGTRMSGVLKIGAIRTVSMRLVPRVFTRMRGIYPDLSFDLTVELSERLTLDVSAGRLDAAIVAEQVGVPAGLSWAPVLTEPLMLVAPPETRGLDAARLLREWPFIRYETGAPLARQIETELSRLGVSPRLIATANTMPSIIGCVQAGLGVAVVPKMAIADAPPGSIWCPPSGPGAVTRRLGVIQRQVSSRVRVLESMRDLLSEAAAESGLAAPDPGAPVGD